MYSATSVPTTAGGAGTCASGDANQPNLKGCLSSVTERQLIAGANF